MRAFLIQNLDTSDGRLAWQPNLPGLLAAMPEVIRYAADERVQHNIFGTVLIAPEVLRNLLFSLAMILIEAGATGGSIAAGREALRMSVPLFAPEYAGMPATATGNRELLREGGRPLLRSRSTMRANLEPVLAVAHQPASIGASATAAQLALIG